MSEKKRFKLMENDANNWAASRKKRFKIIVETTLKLSDIVSLFTEPDELNLSDLPEILKEIEIKSIGEIT
ncbi:MAG: hypothetical protein QXK93_07580 [Candidatus Bathyarchaeia archaeon]